MRILITGSRSWSENIIIHDAIRQAWIDYNKPSLVTIVHGGARGADTIAARFGEQMNFDIEVFPADWEMHGKQAGYIRNAAMVAAGADICLGFIENESRGASMCVRLAEEKGIPTRVWRK